jgi:hypothetical protein
MRISALRRFALAFLILAFAPLQAQAKSDFSGTWKANIAKSDFGPAPPPDSIVEKIVHQEPSLKVNYVQTGGSGNATFDLVYTTDGQECVNHMGGNEIKSTLKWDGDDLVADSKGSYDGIDFTSKDRWTLSGGGKTLTVDRHISASGDEFEMKWVFEKQ